MHMFRIAGLGLAGVFAAGVAAAQDRAVENLNLQVSVQAGVNDDDDLELVSAKGAFPVGDMLGVQIEGAFGNDDYYGGAAHVFWRDPAVALVGAFASAESFIGVELYRVGVEAELYLGDFTLSARGGWQEVGGDHGGFGRADVTWYPIPTLALRAGGEGTPDVGFGRVGFEWQPLFEEYPEFSIFARGEFGGDDRYAVLGGASLHFGGPGLSLRERERHEDPTYAIFNQIAIQASPAGIAALAGQAGQIPPECLEFILPERPPLQGRILRRDQFNLPEQCVPFLPQQPEGDS